MTERRIMLRTRCGCTRGPVVPWPGMGDWVVPMLSRKTCWSMSPEDALDPTNIKTDTRTFRWRGAMDGPYEVWEECE